MLSLALWWLVLELVGLIALPYTLLLFRFLPDRGYALSKALGILFLSYIMWLAALAHLLPFSRGSLLLLMLLLCLGAALLLKYRWQELVGAVKKNLKVILITEALFLFAFLLWALMRSYSPEIRFTEKPMDFAFFNAIGRSEFFSPQDPWLSGHSLNYYYFGYLMMAVVNKLTGTGSSVGFNLAVALLFALAALGVFSLVYNLVKLSSQGKASLKAGIGFALLGVFLFFLLGNGEGVLEFFYARGWGPEGFWQWVGIKGLAQPYTSTAWHPTEFWWWWRASRVIDTLSNGVSLDYTITEFPFFSFLLGDLHAHMMSLPWALLSLAFALNWLHSPDAPGMKSVVKNFFAFIALALVLGSLGFIHAWDLPTYGALFLVVVLALGYLCRLNARGWFNLGGFALLLMATSYLLYAPFFASYHSPVSLVLPWRGPGTRPFHFILLWAPFLFICLSFLLVRLWKDRKEALPWRVVLGVGFVILIPLVLWVGVEVGLGFLYGEGGWSAVARKVVSLLPLLALLGIALLALAKLGKKAREGEERSTFFVLLLIFFAFGLFYGSELYYLLDLHGNRTNTVFRLYYQAWVFLAIASAFSLYYFCRQRLAGWRWLWWGAVALLLASSFFYVPAALTSRSDAFTVPPTLNGLAFLERANPAEKAAVDWLNHEVKGSPVIVEAVGRDYSDYGRISSYTGLPAVLGWFEHEWQWRGNPSYLRNRERDVDLIYRSSDVDEVQRLLDKYGASFLYVGSLERTKYGEESVSKFARFLEVAFQQDEEIIYKVKR